MDINIPNTSARLPAAPTVTAQAPVYVADQRPSADAAAITKRPSMPAAMAIAPWTETMVRSLSLETSVSKGPTSLPVMTSERVLKPYGVVMLPEQDAQNAPKRMR